MALLATVLLALASETYYVSPEGSDAHDGRSPSTAWKTVSKVNSSSFTPGDRILFRRGGEWRESLQASSTGAAGKPILYGDYATGPKPKFWGSDLLPNDRFQDGGTCAVPTPVAAVLADHEFLRPGTWTWMKGTLTLVGIDPRRDRRVFTACVRVDAVHSNGKSHLVFRNLVADETADVRDGYGFRVMGSEDVRLEDCEAYRAGRHHFGTINSGSFVGLRLKCAVAMPNCPGGATFYVSFSDAGRKGDSHQWIDCSAEHLENPGQRNYQVFYNHGEGLGPILIHNLTSHGGMLSVGSSSSAPITLRGGLIEDASLEVFGDHVHVDGLTIRGNGGVDNYGSDGLFENMLVAVEPRNGGPTGYGAGILMRDGAKRNAVRFSTVVIGEGASVKILGAASQTRLSGNVLVSRKQPIEGEAISNQNFTSGDPLLDADFSPRMGSPVIGASRIDHPATDLAGRSRPVPCALGAFEPRK
jgi:hypothetical protein